MKNSDSDTVVSVILAIFLFPIIFITTALNGWVLHTLWGWFVIPMFGLPMLPIAYAIGIAMIVGMMTHQYIDCEPKKADANTKLAGVMLGAVCKPFFYLLFGWIVHKLS